MVNSSNIYNDGGNVGIGTTSPGHALQVVSNTAGTSAMVLQNTTPTGWTSIDYYGDDNNMDFTTGFANSAAGGIFSGNAYLNSYGNNFLLTTNSTEYSLFMNGSNGNIGINTSSPQNNFDVSGGVAIGTYGGVNTAPSNGLIVSGNVGIGNTSPTSALSVGSSSQFQVNGSGNIVKINNVTTSFPSSQGAASTYLKNDGSGNLTWATITSSGGLANGSAAGNTPYWNGSSWVVNSSNIYNDGANVGINTTAPKNQLDVNGSAAFGSYAGSTAAPNNGMIVSGNSGFGTSSPQNKLDVAGGMAIGSYAGSNTGPNNSLIISNTLGVGVTNPISKMDVNGGVSIGSYAGSVGAPANGVIMSGILGVGTSNPKSELDVNGGVAIGSTYAGTIGAPANGMIIQGIVGIATSTPKNNLDVNGDMAIGTYAGVSGAPSNGIIVSGNVGIGTASPSDKLTVNDGNIGINNDNNTASTLRFYEPSSSGTNYMAFKAQAMSANVTYTLPAADGTNGQVLSTNGSGTLAWATAGSGSGWGLTGNSINAATNFIGTTNNTSLRVRTNNAEHMTIDSLGNVGIGTTTPANKLDVNGGVAVGTYAGAAGLTNGILTSGDVGIGTNGDYGTLTVQASGGKPVLLGGGSTTGSELKLVAFGGQHFSLYNNGASNANGFNYLNFANTSTLAQANTAGTSLMVLDQNGRLGIGTTAPMSSLDVSGGISVGSYAGSTASPSNGLIVSGSVGIGTSNPANLFEVTGSDATAAGYFINSNSTAAAAGVYGSQTASTGATYGVYGKSASTTGVGVYGVNNTAGTVYGVEGTTTGNGGTGVFGTNASTGTGTQYGVYGSKTGATATGTGYGVYGTATGTATTNYGGYFTASGGTTNIALDANGSFVLGANGSTLSNVIKGTGTTATLTVPANTTSTQTYTITNAATTGSVVVSPSGALASGLVIAYSYVSTANTVTVAYRNTTGTSVSLASGTTLYITVIQ